MLYHKIVNISWPLKVNKGNKSFHIQSSETWKELFFGLSPDTVEKDLRNHFKQFGQLVDVQVMRNKETSRSREFAFVLFACSFMAEAAMEHEEHILNGVKIKLQFAIQDIPRQYDHYGISQRVHASSTYFSLSNNRAAQLINF